MRAFIALPVLFFGMELGLAPCQAKAECSNDSAKRNMENTSRYSAGFKISIFITISLIRSKFGLIRSKFLQGKLLSPDLDALCGRVYLRNCRLYINALIVFSASNKVSLQNKKLTIFE